ncbi:YrdB family protein [Streptomyces sp. SID13726]|uniref:YrdB family protein n=1 Tax=Streptomyces sp. SID13726 TaxID=2706058 RepID=UPI0013B61A76|nr:YrdB family protein [Streptomyces sp. SID13726]NEB02511.1 YrdB family protein [Streptomyces sp. SID13726]
MKAVNLGVLFLVELGALAGASYWGFTRHVATPLTWLLGLAAPALLIALWALFGARKAPYKTRGLARVGFEALWFGAGVLALVAAGDTGGAVLLGALVVVSKSLAAVWKQ